MKYQKEDEEDLLLLTDYNKDEALRDDINKNFGKKKTSAKSKIYIQDMMNYEVKLIDFGYSKYFVK